jgi:transcription elongation GreA/GreB family factor
MTDSQRKTIEQNIAESRRLGKEADAAADKAIAGLRRAARSARYRGARAQRGYALLADPRTGTPTS